MTVNFTNPEPITEESLKDIITLDFSLLEGSKQEEKEKKKENDGEKKEDKDNPEVFSIKEEKEEEENEDDVSFWTTQINLLADKGFIKEAYEGFDDTVDADEETFFKMLEHNIDKRVDEEFNDFFAHLTPATRKLVEFDMNSEDPAAVSSFIKTLVQETDLKSLNVDNEYHQELILKNWWRIKEGYTEEEIDRKICSYKDKGLLEEEAKSIKPKLDKEVEKESQIKEQEVLRQKQKNAQMKKEFSDKFIKIVEGGKIGEVGVSKEDVKQVYTVLDDEKIEVKVDGVKVKMTPLEAVVYYNKYDPKGSPENLALATLLLLNPKKFEEAYRKVASNKEVEEFVKEHKYNNKFKRSTNKQPKDEKASKFSWNRNF